LQKPCRSLIKKSSVEGQTANSRPWKQWGEHRRGTLGQDINGWYPITRGSRIIALI
jgi:hypothetical protein